MENHCRVNRGTKYECLTRKNNIIQALCYRISHSNGIVQHIPTDRIDLILDYRVDMQQIVYSWQHADPLSLELFLVIGSQADELLPILAPESECSSLFSLVSKSKVFWTQDTHVKFLSMQESQTSTGCLVKSFLYEKSAVWETLDVYDIASIGTLWKGILVTTTAHIDDKIVEALLNAQVLGILCPSREFVASAEGAVGLFREFHKQLRIGSSLKQALDQAEVSQPELTGVFKMILPQ